MWNPATIAALTAGIVAVIGAVGAAVALVRHATDPAAHVSPPNTGKTTAGPTNNAAGST